MPYTMVIGVFAQVLTLLVSSNLLVPCEPDTQLKIGPAHEDSQAVRHVRSTSDGSTDYEEYGDRLVEQEDHVKPEKSGTINRIIFEVYQLLGSQKTCWCSR